jgi:hypothetical protein
MLQRISSGRDRSVMLELSDFEKFVEVCWKVVRLCGTLLDFVKTIWYCLYVLFVGRRRYCNV